jgi:hypothetical protein
VPDDQDASIQRWFLTDKELRNPASDIRAWTSGNTVQPLVDGAVYFGRLREALARTRSGDQVYFADYREHTEEILDGPGTSVG